MVFTLIPERCTKLRGLYAVTPEMADGDRLCSLVNLALKGGASLVQFRAKTLSRRERLVRAARLLNICRQHNVPLIINDDPELAEAIGADGVHVGRSDPDPRKIRERLPDVIIGVSCYDQPNLALSAAEAGADYVGVGSIFPSQTKPEATWAGLHSILLARQLGGLPVAAIGGINVLNVREAEHAGADMVAVISALFDASDVQATAHALSQPFSF